MMDNTTMDNERDNPKPNLVYYAETLPTLVAPNLRLRAERRLAAVCDTFAPLQDVPVTIRWIRELGTDLEDALYQYQYYHRWFAQQDIGRDPDIFPEAKPYESHETLGMFRHSDPAVIYLRAEPWLYNRLNRVCDTVTHECVHLMQYHREETRHDRLEWKEGMAYSFQDFGWHSARALLLARRRRAGNAALRLPGPLSEAEAKATLRQRRQTPEWRNMLASWGPVCMNCFAKTPHPLPDYPGSYYIGEETGEDATARNLCVRCPECHSLNALVAYSFRRFGVPVYWNWQAA